MTEMERSNTMSKGNSTVIGGNGFCGLLFITFLVLKLTHVIDWSWWWITAPLWVPIGAVATLFVVLTIIYYILSTTNSTK